MDQKDKILRITKGNKRKSIEARDANSQSKNEKNIFGVKFEIDYFSRKIIQCMYRVLADTVHTPK